MTEATAVSLPGPTPGGTHTGTGSTPLCPGGPAPPHGGSRHLGAHHLPPHLQKLLNPFRIMDLAKNNLRIIPKCQQRPPHLMLPYRLMTTTLP